MIENIELLFKQKRGMAMAYKGILDINWIVSKKIQLEINDTFIIESIDNKGFAAIAYLPGCRPERGTWSDFKILHSGCWNNCIDRVESYGLESNTH